MQLQGEDPQRGSMSPSTTARRPARDRGDVRPEQVWNLWISPRPGKWQELVRRAVTLDSRLSEAARGRHEHKNVDEPPHDSAAVSWSFTERVDRSALRPKGANAEKNLVCFILQQSEFIPVLEQLRSGKQAGGVCWITRYPGMAEMCAKVNMARYFRRLGDQLLAGTSKAPTVAAGEIGAAGAAAGDDHSRAGQQTPMISREQPGARDPHELSPPTAGKVGMLKTRTSAPGSIFKTPVSSPSRRGGNGTGNVGLSPEEGCAPTSRSRPSSRGGNGELGLSAGSPGRSRKKLQLQVNLAQQLGGTQVGLEAAFEVEQEELEGVFDSEESAGNLLAERSAHEMKQQLLFYQEKEQPLRSGGDQEDENSSEDGGGADDGAGVTGTDDPVLITDDAVLENTAKRGFASGTSSGKKKKKKRGKKKKKSEIKNKMMATFCEPSKHFLSTAHSSFAVKVGPSAAQTIRLPPLLHFGNKAQNPNGGTGNSNSIDAVLSPGRLRERDTENPVIRRMSQTCAALISPKRGMKGGDNKENNWLTLQNTTTSTLDGAVGGKQMENNIGPAPDVDAQVEDEVEDGATVADDCTIESDCEQEVESPPPAPALAGAAAGETSSTFAPQDEHPLRPAPTRMTKNNFFTTSSSVKAAAKPAPHPHPRQFVLHEHMPKTFVYPEDEAKIAAYLEPPLNSPVPPRLRTLICKPEDSSQGHGIFMINRLRDLQVRASTSRSTLVVQEYIDTPLLLHGYKFDLRVYVVLSGLGKNFRVFIGKEALVRFCTKKYEMPFERGFLNGAVCTGSPCGRMIDAHSEDLARHLCNYSINKKSKDFVRSAECDEGLLQKLDELMGTVATTEGNRRDAATSGSANNTTKSSGKNDLRVLAEPNRQREGQDPRTTAQGGAEPRTETEDEDPDRMALDFNDQVAVASSKGKIAPDAPTATTNSCSPSHPGARRVDLDANFSSPTRASCSKSQPILFVKEQQATVAVRREEKRYFDFRGASPQFAGDVVGEEENSCSAASSSSSGSSQTKHWTRTASGNILARKSPAREEAENLHSKNGLSIAASPKDGGGGGAAKQLHTAVDKKHYNGGNSSCSSSPHIKSSHEKTWNACKKYSSICKPVGSGLDLDQAATTADGIVGSPGMISKQGGKTASAVFSLDDLNAARAAASHQSKWKTSSLFGSGANKNGGSTGLQNKGLVPGGAGVSAVGSALPGATATSPPPDSEQKPKADFGSILRDIRVMQKMCDAKTHTRAKFLFSPETPGGRSEDEAAAGAGEFFEEEEHEMVGAQENAESFEDVDLRARDDEDDVVCENAEDLAFGKAGQNQNNTAAPHNTPAANNTASKRLLSVVLEQIEQEYPARFSRTNFYEQLSDVCGQWAEGIHPYLIATYRPFYFHGEPNAANPGDHHHEQFHHDSFSTSPTGASTKSTKCIKNPKHFYEHNQARCCQMLGFDLLLDDNFKLHLIEVNSGPSLNVDDVVPLEECKKSEYSRPPCLCGDYPEPHRHEPSPIDMFVKTHVMQGLFALVRESERRLSLPPMMMAATSVVGSPELFAIRSSGGGDAGAGSPTIEGGAEKNTTSLEVQLCKNTDAKADLFPWRSESFQTGQPYVEVDREAYTFAPLLKKLEAWFSCKVNHGTKTAGDGDGLTSSFHVRRAFSRLRNLESHDLDLEYTKMKREFVQPYIKSPLLNARFDLVDLIPVLEAVRKKKGFRSMEKLLDVLIGGGGKAGK